MAAESETEVGKIFHISEEGDIKVFEPRPSPSFFADITGDVVFGIAGRLLHNYLLPRNCPRVTYYAGPNTLPADKEMFLPAGAGFVINVEDRWKPVIEHTTLFCYELNKKDFILLDEIAGYYISYKQVSPVSVRQIDNVLEEIEKRKNVALHFIPNLWDLAEKVAASTLNFSLIRMKNAAKD